MTAPALLEIRDLSLSVRGPGRAGKIVDGLSLRLGRGATLGLVGPSGSGKSLTALAVLGLLPREVVRSGGSVWFDGVELSSLSEGELRRYRGKRIALVFQEPMSSFHPLLRIGTQVGEVLKLHRGLAGAQKRAELARLFGEVGLPEPERLPRRYPHELSGGMLQRVMIAMALAGEPELIIADEPTTALDVTVQAQILELVRRLQRERGLSLLWISHDLGVVAQVCDEVAVLHGGRVVEQDAVAELFARPRHPYTSELLGAASRFPGGWRVAGAPDPRRPAEASR